MLSTKWTDLHEVISADTINNGGVNQDGVLPPIVNHSCQLVHSHQNGKPKECKNVTLSHIFPAGGCYLTHLTQSMSIVQVGLPHDQSDQSKQCLQNRSWNGDGWSNRRSKWVDSDWLGWLLPGRSFISLLQSERWNISSRVLCVHSLIFSCQATVIVHLYSE